jgi:uncharacterized membrane protein YuzA (DUF378 family)
MRRSWLTIVFPALALPCLAFALFVEMNVLPYLIIGVACMIPLVVCFTVVTRFPRVIARFPRLVLALIYLLCSAATIWFLVSFGDDLLPVGSSTGGRHAVDATGGFLAAWTGLVLTLFGIAAVWLMIADAREQRRKARPAQGGAHPESRPVRRVADKSPGRRAKQHR